MISRTLSTLFEKIRRADFESELRNNYRATAARMAQSSGRYEICAADGEREMLCSRSIVHIFAAATSAVTQVNRNETNWSSSFAVEPKLFLRKKGML